ncbi:hypothetical protein AQ490_17440 [Wenjunlia vitaminophila]|uniref:SAF domain-containing protein n=1 Tax=Wenjunlia vitaminophila TaxID=76728 RepID=A0A0T6LV69_WENVI|nr:hypothetical protein AQ490_17440 [Wenjunlia vitaminophila]
MFEPIRAKGGRHRLRRTLRRRRRAVASGLAMTVAALAATAQRGAGPPTARTEPVLVAARDLSAGAQLHNDDVTTARLPADQVPRGVVRRAEGVRGRTLAGPVRHGEPLTDRRLLGPSLLAGYGARGEHYVAAPIRVADAATAALLRPGDRIDVLAGPLTGAGEPAGDGSARVVAAGARVVAVPPRQDDGPGAARGALVVLAVPRAVARCPRGRTTAPGPRGARWWSSRCRGRWPPPSPGRRRRPRSA